MKKISVMKDVMSANNHTARLNRTIFDQQKALVLNIMSSPGAGKTSLVLSTIERLPDKKILVIEGDVAGDIDAQKIGKTGTKVFQINTGDGCHLNASMVYSVVEKLPWKRTDLILIENVGNLICPAEFELGEDKKVVLLSVPEGHDKPEKYPVMFEKADLLLVSKTDLMPYSDFNLEDLRTSLKKINPGLGIIPFSCKTGEGLDQLEAWLKGALYAKN